jgi:aryl sulfotransferase
VLLVHYNDLKLDCESEIRRVGDFLEITLPAALWPEIAAAADFNVMRLEAEALLPTANIGWNGGASRFLNKGTTGQWCGVLSKRLLALYDAQIRSQFTPSLARWVADGRLGPAHYTHAGTCAKL